MEATAKLEILTILRDIKQDLVNRRYGDAFVDVEEAIRRVERLDAEK